MKANQFRIGNTVKYNGKAYKLYGIAEEYPFLDTNEFGVRVVQWNDILSVEITEEALKELGFVKEKSFAFDYMWSYYNEHKNIYFKIVQDRNCYSVLGLHFGTRLFFVHEIQNIYFVLIGEELIINTEKL